jgi:uncharacterized membrane protein
LHTNKRLALPGTVAYFIGAMKAALACLMIFHASVFIDCLLIGRRESVLALVSVVPQSVVAPNQAAAPITPASQPAVGYDQSVVDQDLLASFGQSLQETPPIVSRTSDSPEPSNDGRNLDQALRDSQRAKLVGPITHGI